MEELHSTEALDREILEDARKRADKILKAAAETIKKREQEWQTWLEQSRSHLKAQYEERLKAAEKEIMSRLPLEKRRFRSLRAETLLKKAMDTFIQGVPRSQILALLAHQLEKRLAPVVVSASEEVLVSSVGLTQEELGMVLQKSLGTLPSRVVEASFARDSYPSLVVEGRGWRIRLSLQELVEDLLLEKRAELASALLGEGVLDD
ncbi:MAG: hypothetical protein N2509_05740 [Treponemataceae bacterium]|nr:hypothetical protein [Treponemataceae bacterium]